MDTISLLDKLVPEGVRKNRIGHHALRALWSLSPSGRRPSFLIIGAQKAGTTFIHNVISGHPRVKRPVTKEVAFFTYSYSRGLPWYLSHFPKTSDGVLTYESTADYLFHPPAPERIAKHLPDAKLIICLREPVSRAVSHYGHSVAKGFETLPFRDAILTEDDRLAPEYAGIERDPDYSPRALLRFSYAAKGHYLDQIHRYERLFPREQLLFLDSKEIFKETNSALVKVERFLGLEEWMPPAAVPAKNVGVAKPELDEEALAYLKERFKEPNRALFDHLGWRDPW